MNTLFFSWGKILPAMISKETVIYFILFILKAKVHSYHSWLWGLYRTFQLVVKLMEQSFILAVEVQPLYPLLHQPELPSSGFYAAGEQV